jgi:hypothetical protein
MARRRAKSNREFIVDEESVAMPDNSESGFLVGAAPVIGAAAGTLASTMGAFMLGVPVQWAPWGTAAIGAVGAFTTQGWVRQAAIGVAAAGASIGILRMMGIIGGHSVAPVDHHRQAAPPEADPSPPADSVTRADLQKGMDELAAKYDVQIKQLAEQYGEQVRDMQRAYSGRIEEIRASYDQRLAAKDETISELLRELRTAETTALHVVPRDAEAVAEEALTVGEASAVDEEQAPANDVETPSPVADWSKAKAVFDLLTPEEAAQLQQIIAGMPAEAVAMAEAHLANLEPEQAAAYLRSSVLTPRDAA